MGDLVKWQETPILETDRLFLRKFRLEDVKDVFAYAKDPQTARFVSWDAHKSEDDSLRFLKWAIERYHIGAAADWAVMDKQTGHIIGSMGLVHVEEQNRCCEIGYVIGQTYWGQGYTAEALERVLRFLFEACGINRVQAMVCNENTASSRVLEKTGFTNEGLMRQRMRMKGRFWDMQLYAIVLESWRATNEPSGKVQDRVLVEEAEEADLEAILALQKRSYASEAEIYGYAIAPMTQTLEEIRSSYKNQLFLKAVLNDSIIGSIRARIAEGSCFIGRLIVEPAHQHQGIGRRLLNTMEALHPGMRFELFTGHLSTRNLDLYGKMGYKPFKTVRIQERESLVYLEKKPESSMES